jgi:histidinol-phosphatase (PHP family)
VVDYHIHTEHSIDASGTISEYCDQAVKIGLTEICFTNHCELDPERNDSFISFNGKREPFSKNGLLRLQSEVHEAQEKYREQGLAVKFGIEIGYYHGIEQTLHRMLDGPNLDFVIGAIHCLDHICIDSTKECDLYFDRHSVPEFIDHYFTAVMELISSGMFDSIAHLDVYKKYGHKYYGDDIYDVPLDMVSDIFRMMKNKHVALEINTAGMRFMNEFYPSPILMKQARKEGVELFTVGSDSHRPEDLGRDLAQAIQYLKSYGYNAVCTFDKRRRHIFKV